ncbi:MAG: serine/threonine-protein kinase [Vicinamibacteria bacterium]
MIDSIGKYRVVRLLGAGAMGEVYLGEDPLIGRSVAIKVMKPGAEEDHERFRQEARIVGGLSHPNIVVLHEFGFHEERPYLVMQYLPGASLEDWLRGEHTLGEHVRIMEGLVGALDYAHGRGVLHRDLKPSNVQVTPEGECRLMDFGIARVPEAKLTATGTIMGTPAYMAPEILGDAHYSTRADNYSAAVVLYEMLAGRNPFLGQTVSSTLTNVLNREPQPLSSLRPEAPAELSAAIMAQLQKDPRSRPADLSGLIAVLRALQSGAGASELAAVAVRATQSLRDARDLVPRASRTVDEVAAHPASRRPLAVAAVGAVALLAAALWLSRGGPSSESQAPPAAPPPLGPSSQAASEVSGGSPTPDPQLRIAQDTQAKRAAAAALLASPPAAASTPARSAPGPSAAGARATPAPATSTPAPATLPSPSAAPVPMATPPPVPSAPPSTVAPTAAPQRQTTAGVAPAGPPPPMLTGLTPVTARRGGIILVDLRGGGFRSDHRVRVLRGGHDVPGIRVMKQTLIAPDHIRVALHLGADVGLGSYSVVVVDPGGAFSESLSFEVVL